MSIGIPSYNEESNIITILEKIINSDFNSVELAEVIISDDSNDNTPDLVEKFIKNHSQKIVFLHNKTRRGTANAWNNIIQNATGQIIVLYDADVVPNPNCTLELVEKIKPNVGICASNPRPIPGEGISARSTIFVSEWLESVRKRQLTKYTVMGRGLSIRSDIAKKIIIPDNVIAIDLYMQTKVQEMGYDVVFNPNAIVLFKPAMTLIDFTSQVVRAINGHSQLQKLGCRIKNKLALKTAIVELIRVALRNPIGAISATLCYISIPFYMVKIKNVDTALWHTAYSTK